MAPRKSPYQVAEGQHSIWHRGKSPYQENERQILVWHQGKCPYQENEGLYPA